MTSESKGRSSVGAILFGALIGLILTSALFMIGIPALGWMNSGLEIQSQYEEFDDSVNILDETTTIEKIAGCEMNITTSGRSKLRVQFDGVALLHLGDFQGSTKYNITLAIDGVQNKTTRISYYSSTLLTGATEIFLNIHIEFETDTLDAATYTISVYWNSILDVTTGSSQIALSTPMATYPYSLGAQEIGTANIINI